ncbi:MAG: baseplate assembly protein [Shewanella sp.]
MPPLSAVKQVTQEEILADMAKVGGLGQQSPSNPAYRAMMAGSYRETLMRREADEQVRAVMLATSVGGDLDHIGVTYYRDIYGKPVHRLDGEDDQAYRLRLHDSPGGLSTAGPTVAYEFHSRSAHPNIKSALCTSPEAVHIRMYVLGHAGDGTVPKVQCDLVDAYLWERRPLTDKVTVVSAEIVNYTITARVYQVKNSDPDTIMARSVASLKAYTELQHRMRGRVTLSALHAVMMVSGVEEVVLEGWSDVNCGQHQAPYCTAMNIEFGGWSETQALTRPGVPNEWA